MASNAFMGPHKIAPMGARKPPLRLISPTFTVTLAARTESDPSSESTRPALLDGAATRIAEAAEVLRQREARYREAADVVVETAGRSPEEVAREIIRELRTRVETTRD